LVRAHNRIEIDVESLNARFQAGETVVFLAREIGCSAMTVYRRLRVRRRLVAVWVDERLLVTRYRFGVSLQRIAAELGCSRRTLQRRIERLRAEGVIDFRWTGVGPGQKVRLEVAADARIEDLRSRAAAGVSLFGGTA
jgi:transposase-like protein